MKIMVIIMILIAKVGIIIDNYYNRGPHLKPSVLFAAEILEGFKGATLIN